MSIISYLFFRDNNATVIGVLDEMINIEYDKDENFNIRRVNTTWVDTENKNLLLLALNNENDDNMQVEK